MAFRINQINLIRKYSVTFFHLEFQGNAVLVKCFGYLECWAIQIRLAKFLLPNSFAKPRFGECIFLVVLWFRRSFVGMDQSGSGVAGLSSFGIVLNHSGLCLIFGRWAESVSSESYILVVFGIDDYGAGGYEEPEVPELCRFFLLRSESSRGGGGGS
ncbi:hypothetical protein Tco_0611673 [Tanacetum coccineum]